MDSATAELKSDFFLHEVPNVKISKDKPVCPRTPLKVEMLSLRLSEISEKLIMETLSHIHGQDFKLNDITSYKDKKSNLKHRYWVDRGTLVVKGGSDNSHINKEEFTEDKFKMFALLRLESYGFFKSHCMEALNYCNGEVDRALELLFFKYYNLNHETNIHHTFSREELLEQRVDEKNVLQSIYETAFQEKISNQVWVLTFNLNYVLNLYSNKPREPKKIMNTNKKLMCKYILKGIPCKYANKCKFSHEIEKETKKSNLDYSNFELEIRFPKDSQYPFEPPFIFLKSPADLPSQVCLHICRRLLREAQDLSEQGIVSVYSIAELLQNEGEIIMYLKFNLEKFLPENESLFEQNSASVVTKPLPTHYRKGLTSRDNKLILTSEEILREDILLVKEFKNKLDNPKYLKSLERRQNLPVWRKMKEILNTIRSSQVVVISGETGCGKSTQVPQFVLDDWMLNYNGEHVEIICTQPRRISAIGVAERVSEERLEKIGKSVGYQIRLESKVSTSTRLSFCTTGILLRKLECEPLLQSVSHIIVDEVHERSEDSDFLLLCLKCLLPHRPDLKIILMSATLDAHIFCSYFEGVPTLEIPGRTFPVQQLFLEDILERTEYIVEENSQYTRVIKRGGRLQKEIDTSEDIRESSMPQNKVKDENCTLAQILARYREYSARTCKNLYMLDSEKLNLDLIEHLLVWLVSGEHEFPQDGSVLVFLPGIAEIRSLIDQLAECAEFSTHQDKYVLLPLHSSLSGEEQAEVFKKPANGARKIILATNIAETSITIDDCVFVVDGGRAKERRWDAARGVESLQLVWESRANALQRCGRAGRVRAGVCFYLFTRNRYKEQMLQQPVPELLRVPLDRLVLRIKILPSFADRTIYSVLSDCLEPPSTENIYSAVQRLQDVGALDQTQELTPLGLHLAALPVDVRIGKLALLGAIFCCVDAALTMAACLSYRSPFQAPFAKKQQADAKKKLFAVANSDQLTTLKAYNKWREVSSRSRHAGYVFAQEHYLSSRTLETLAEMKYQLLELLVSIGFVPVDLTPNSKPKVPFDTVLQITGSQLNKHGDNHQLLVALLCAALYPNVAKVLSPEKSFSVSYAGAVPRKQWHEELRFRTKDDGFVALHPSSVNYSVDYFPSPYLVFQEKLRTSRVFIRDCSMVPTLPLVLFSGFTLDVQVHNGTTVLVLADGWIIFQVEKHEVAEILKLIRTELLALLEEKIKDPLLNLLNHENGKKIISTIVHIISNN